MQTDSDPNSKRNITFTGVVLAVVAVLAIVAITAYAFVGDFGADDPSDVGDAGDSTHDDPTTTQAGPAAFDASTDTPATPELRALAASEAAQVVWPPPEGELRYDDPEAAARGFAEDLAGFIAPLYGALQEGDARSGEIAVRANERGAVTTVLVRRLSDDHWWVLGAATDDVVVEAPAPGASIASPLVLSGRARAFEGTVQVAVIHRATGTRVGEGFVTGSGSGDLGPFEDTITWPTPTPPVAGPAVLLFYTVNMEDGQVWQAAAFPITLSAP
jgi:hypothetical protein